MRVGISGYAGSGKDEVADVLVDAFGFVKVNMSDALHRYMSILNPIIGPSGMRYAEAIQGYGYTQTKALYPEARRLLQVFGTEVGRAIDPDIWMRELDKLAALHEHVVTTGIRFPNETTPLGMLIHVERPGVGPVNGHASDDLSSIRPLANILIVNDGTLDDLREQTLSAFAAALAA